MGAGQSSAGGDALAVDVKTSYYDLLGVDRQATEDEIKKAYRRKALELHPDRNYGNVDNATQLFADVQSAYEVLSDPQERAWYDSHEHSILHGGGGSAGEDSAQHEHYERNVRLTTADELSRIILKFNARVEFTDSPSGFFGFLRDTFDDIVSQEAAVAASASQLHPSDAQVEIREQYPSFGHRDDSHDDIRSFYAAWSSFSTRRSYAWVDRWRPSDAPDRRTRRLVEKENRRLRDDAIQEFNDAVRALVEFSRKRDPRYKPTTQSDAERQRVLKDAATAQRARARAANEERLKEHVVPDWAKSRDPEPNQMEAGEEVWDEEEKELDEFECVVCRKTFKSERQYEAHEKSKKHQKALHALRKQMRRDNVELELDEAARSDAEDGSSSRSDSGEFATRPELTAEGDWSDQERAENGESGSDGHSAASYPISSTLPTVSSSDTESLDDYGDEYAPQEKVEERFARGLDTDDDTPAEDDSRDEAKVDGPSNPKMGKAAQKRAKKAAQKASTEADGSNNQFTCATCTATFPSRSRMFQHLKDFRHAAPVTTTKKVPSKGAKRR